MNTEDLSYWTGLLPQLPDNFGLQHINSEHRITWDKEWNAYYLTTNPDDEPRKYYSLEELMWDTLPSGWVLVERVPFAFIRDDVTGVWKVAYQEEPR